MPGMSHLSSRAKSALKNKTTLGQPFNILKISLPPPLPKSRGFIFWVLWNLDAQNTIQTNPKSSYHNKVSCDSTLAALGDSLYEKINH